MADHQNNWLFEQLMKTYDLKFEGDGISGQRIAKRLNALANIGKTAENGSNRSGYSEAEAHAQKLVASWMKQAGLNVREDGAGNIIGRLAGKEDTLPVIMSGSHVDSVPNGGHFDGTLGVIAALEVVEAWNTQGYQPIKPYEVVIFADEEGSRFNGGLNGSEAMVGNHVIERKKQLQDKDGLKFAEVLQMRGLSVESYQNAARDMKEIELFVELHIEQGKILEKENVPCGIVTGIAGPCWLEITFIGEAGHAGNTPMNDRKDALVAASELVWKVNQLPSQVSDSAVATIGKQIVEPNGVNVIPGKVTLYVDIRDIYEKTRDELMELVKQLAGDIAAKHGMAVNIMEKTKVKPVPINNNIQDLLETAMKKHRIRPLRLPSGAGHDAMIIGEKVPIAMLFVKSRKGISHNPEEWSDLTDCVQAIQVLKTSIENLQSDEVTSGVFK
ncbi:M20 family metallo-hydrolase [Virgibacillus proomii]|jgi:allantoate deiminase|uniref:M20 family metallo-hydrolase n=1 Tax=Virgibacillus proomii TaxID=84407 RepID=UPI000986E54A|nr:M20 family metallo-hydrolase [Virgibacillus proomii]